MLIRLWALLTFQRLVWLQHKNGNITLAIAKNNPFGGMIAEIYWPYNIRKVQLLPDGKCGVGYISKWKFYKE